MLAEEVACLKEQLAYFQRLLFGRKSEKMLKTFSQENDRQLTFDFGDEPRKEQELTDCEDAKPEVVDVKVHKRSK